jgi:hypothetical protein
LYGENEETRVLSQCRRREHERILNSSCGGGRAARKLWSDCVEEQGGECLKQVDIGAVELIP